MEDCFVLSKVNMKQLWSCSKVSRFAIVPLDKHIRKMERNGQGEQGPTSTFFAIGRSYAVASCIPNLTSKEGSTLSCPVSSTPSRLSLISTVRVVHILGSALFLNIIPNVPPDFRLPESFALSALRRVK